MMQKPLEPSLPVPFSPPEFPAPERSDIPPSRENPEIEALPPSELPPIELPTLPPDTHL